MRALSRKLILAALASTILLAAAGESFAQSRPAPTAEQLAMRAAGEDASAAIQELRQLTRDPAVYTTESKRTEALSDAKPLFERIDAASAVFAKGGVQGKATVKQIDNMTNGIRVALGEPIYVAKLETAAKSSDAKEAAAANSMLAYGKYKAIGGDEAGQKKLIDAMADALKSDPASDAIAGNLFGAYNEPNTIKEVRTRIEDLIKNTAKSPSSQAIARQWAAAEKLAAFENKPLTVKNFTLDGKEFSSDSLKGKVVIVDFWATWCGPCIQEMPRMVKLYEEFHPKGLEIVSISFDKDTDDIKKFLGEHKEVTWIQTFNPKTPGWSAGEEWGINSIPRMFVVDKKGVCRTINGRAQMEKMIPELLAE